MAEGSAFPSPCTRADRAQGFSVVEVLIAAAIFLIIAVGMLPLFTSSMQSNAAGSDFTNAANLARSALEELRQLNFEDPDLSPAGGATSKTTTAYYLQGALTKLGDERWADAPPAIGKPLWERRMTLRAYSVSALDDGRLDPAEALPGDTQSSFVHLREIEVEIESGRRETTGLGWRRRTNMRTAKAF